MDIVSIPTDQLVPGAIYLVSAKDFSVAIWNGEAFRGPRYADANWSLADEMPYETGLPYGTAYAIERVGEAVLRPPYDGFNVMQVLIAFDAFLSQGE